jgi:hypothetical protein
VKMELVVIRIFVDICMDYPQNIYILRGNVLTIHIYIELRLVRAQGRAEKYCYNAIIRLAILAVQIHWKRGDEQPRCGGPDMHMNSP